MKKVEVLFFVLFILSFACTSCQEEILDEALEKSEIIIKMALPDVSQSNLKSASVNDPIQNGDTVDVLNLKMMNIIFTAEDQNGKSLVGNWNIDLIDSDNNTNNQRLSERPSALFQETNIASIKPSELGLYVVLFHGKGKYFQFYLRHSGLPGDIGDDIQGGHHFRMEKKSLYVFSDEGKIKTAYTLYLKIDEDEFKNWGPADGVNPNNKDLWRALLFCGGENFFSTKNGATYSAKNFKLREAKYSKGIYSDNESYYCFTFFPEDTPPSDRFGGKSYQVQFYAGEYGENWWTFSSNHESSWKKGVWSVFEFMIF